MAETDVSICSRALVLLGAGPITSLNDENDRSRVCAAVYPSLKLSLMSRYGWRCLMTKKKLTQDAVKPIGEWGYSHLIPPEALSLPHAVFFAQGNQLATNRFEVFGRRVFSDHPELWMDFTVAKPEAELPAWFIDMLTAALCAEIAFSITDQQNVADGWTYKAYGTPADDGNGGKVGDAMIIDSQGSGNVGFQDQAFIDARFGGWF